MTFGGTLVMAAFLHFVGGDGTSDQVGFSCGAKRGYYAAERMQAPTSPPAASVSAPAPRAKPTATVAYVRPPPGLARGKYEVDGWLVAITAVALIGIVVAFFVIRQRRAARRRGYESVVEDASPMSSRR
jgi:hypothetical protein